MVIDDGDPPSTPILCVRFQTKDFLPDGGFAAGFSEFKKFIPHRCSEAFTDSLVRSSHVIESGFDGSPSPILQSNENLGMWVTATTGPLASLPS